MVVRTATGTLQTGTAHSLFVIHLTVPICQIINKYRLSRGLKLYPKPWPWTFLSSFLWVVENTRMNWFCCDCFRRHWKITYFIVCVWRHVGRWGQERRETWEEKANQMLIMHPSPPELSLNQRKFNYRKGCAARFLYYGFFSSNFHTLFSLFKF